MKLKWIWQPEQRFKNAWLRGAGEAGEFPHFKCQIGWHRVSLDRIIRSVHGKYNCITVKY